MSGNPPLDQDFIVLVEDSFFNSLIEAGTCSPKEALAVARQAARVLVSTLQSRTRERAEVTRIKDCSSCRHLSDDLGRPYCEQAKVHIREPAQYGCSWHLPFVQVQVPA